jgi:hypothetical protein
MEGQEASSCPTNIDLLAYGAFQRTFPSLSTRASQGHPRVSRPSVA